VIDRTEHASRIARLQEALAAQGLSAALLLNAVDMLYLAGTRQLGALLVPASGQPTLLVRKSFARARAEAAVEDVRPFPSSKELAAALPAARGKVGAAFEAVPQATLDFWRKALPEATLAPLGTILREQRAVKSPAELALMREGGARIAGVLRELPTFLRAGMREVDLSAEIEVRLRRAGNEGVPRLRGFNLELFLGLAVAGPGAAGPGYFDGPVVGQGLSAAYPQGASERVIGPGEPVLVDFTFVHQGYVVDITRCAAVGDLAPELLRGFEVARAIQDEAARHLRPGIPAAELWEHARYSAERAGLGPNFMGPPGDNARFLGHGVGLELDELPVLAPGFNQPLRAGQTIAIEPKFVFPGLGAVGIENTFVVTEQGGEKLTAGVPDEILRA
jgi:Xaa-Pro aminopeptidase